MKKKILIDVDEVICDPGFLYLINEFLGANYKIDDFTEYYLDDVLGSDANKQKFYKYYLEHNSYHYAKIFPHAKEVLKRLNEIYDVYICSACANPFFLDKSANQYANKYNFLIENFPFLDPEKFIFTSVKNIFVADIQIDDRLGHLKGNIPLKILFPSYHNKTITDEELKENNVIRVGHSREDAWQEIEKLLIN